jgi:hypothetical protein
VTSENKLHKYLFALPARSGLVLFAVLVLVSAFAAPVLAADPVTSAPSLFNISEVIVKFADFPNEEAANSCALSKTELANILNRTLKDNGVPSTPVAEALPPLAGRARIELVPMIATYAQGLECTSWISLAAQSRGNVRAFYGDITRRVTVDYWRSGLLLSTAQTTHEEMVANALKKLALDFAKQFKADQPGPLLDQEEWEKESIGVPVRKK